MDKVALATPGPKPREKTLLVSPSWIGDAIMAQPLLARLQTNYPTAQFDVLAPPWCAPVWKRMRGIREIILNPFDHGDLGIWKRRQLGHQLALTSYDRAVILPNSLKSALIPYFAKIPQRTGYRGEFRYGLINDICSQPPPEVIRLVDRYYWLGQIDSERANPAAAHRTAPPPQLNRSSLGYLTSIASKFNLSKIKPIVIFCPGAEYGPAKRWPAAHFGLLAQELLQRDIAVWLLGSHKDQESAQEISTLAPEVTNLCGKTNLEEALTLLEIGTFVVTNDSGLMHAAAALGKPLISLFGSSSPSYTPPLAREGNLATLLRLDLPCSPCYARICPLGHLKCLRDLDPRLVYDKVVDSLNALPSIGRDDA